jgi:hypothetical protein
VGAGIEYPPETITKAHCLMCEAVCRPDMWRGATTPARKFGRSTPQERGAAEITRQRETATRLFCPNTAILISRVKRGLAADESHAGLRSSSQPADS